MHKVVCISGAQWGDEGKGKIVDFSSERADIVARYSGGANAGHTLVINRQIIIVHLLPSGIIRAGIVCVLGDGMVIDPESLLKEMSDVKKAGKEVSPENVKISKLAHIVMPYHKSLDELREKDSNNNIGTTKKGIGQTYEFKASRVGIRMEDLFHLKEKVVEDKLVRALIKANKEIDELNGKTFTLSDAKEFLLYNRDRLLPYITDTSALLNDALLKNKKILFEGAQGAALDIDRGTYPWVTSSSTMAGAAGIGCGIDPRRVEIITGVVKAYLTRVGSGPFPTELLDNIGEHLRKEGKEFGSTTGRPRRAGWLDMVQLRYAVETSGIDRLAITKLDVLRGLRVIKVCYAYDVNGRIVENWGELAPYELENVRPLYSPMAGFDEDISNVKKFDDLPKSAQQYLRSIAFRTKKSISLISVGPDREQTIEIERVF